MTEQSRAIREIARKVFHYKKLRPGQDEAISAILNGHDTLAVMPTGSGKSALYQIPALMLDGPAVVVSPLIALQKDQAEHLQALNAGGAAIVNSLLSQRAIEETLAEAGRGETEFLFLGPEQLSNPERIEALKGLRPSLFVVDEAHCISEWGHSFRPDYLHLNNVIEVLGHPTILAITATANADVREEIIARLGMRNPKIFVHGFDRPNIWIGVETAASEEKKRALLFERIRKTEPPGIVYTSTRKHAEEIHDELNSAGLRSGFYHGALSRNDREAMQEKFMADELEIIVATCAFGLGIDKPNVRFVFHYEAPDSIDSYYQEIGRAGRDGLPSTAVLFYHSHDLTIHKFFKGAGQIQAADVKLVLDEIADRGAVDTDELRKEVRLSKIKIERILNRLEDCGVLEVQPDGVARATGDAAELPDAAAEIAQQAADAQSSMHQAELDRIETMRRYAESMGCRRAYVMAYFDEVAPGDCGNCDNCQGCGTARAELIAETKLRAETELRAENPAA